MRITKLLATVMAIIFVNSCTTDIIEPSRMEQIQELERELNINLELIDDFDVSNAIEVSSLEEFKNRLEDIKGSLINKTTSIHNRPSVIGTPLTTCGQFNGSIFAEHHFGLGADINFVLDYKHGIVKSVDTYLTGVTIGIDYQKVSFSQDPIKTREVKVCGIAKYVLFWDGIGTVYSQQLDWLILSSCEPAMLSRVSYSSCI